MTVLFALIACQEPAPTDGPDGTTTFGQTGSTPPTGTTGDTATPGTTAETGDSGGTVACDGLPAPLSYQAIASIWTEEDFDFDTEGRLLTQDGSSLLGITRMGSEVVAANVGLDIAGIRSLPNGDVIVAQQDTQAVRRANLTTNGATVTVFGGLDFPNGLEVEQGGQAYVSEYSPNGAVRKFDPYTGDNEVILRIAYPNGLALSPDEQTLYVAVSEALFAGSGRVMAIDRDATGTWDESTLRVVHEADDLLDALAVDVCGNLYVTTYRRGQVIRVATDGTTELLVDLPNVNFEGYCAARFGHGVGDWERTKLYVSDRYEVYAIDVGIEGRHVLAQ